MPHRPRLQCPTLDFLDEVERAFAVVWPASFRAFCRANASSRLNERYPSLRGNFICDRTGLEEANVRIGEGSWGDYEKAITGKRHPKDGSRLYLDFLPFYVQKKDVYGFLTDDADGDKVVVWAVHTLVHDYPSFDEWLRREGAGPRRH